MSKALRLAIHSATTYRIFLLLFLTVITTSWVLAQGPKFNGKDANFSEIEVSLAVDKVKDLKMGDVITMKFTAKLVVDGWHLYSSRKDGNIAYLPTELFLFEKETKGIKLQGGMTENKKCTEVDDELMGGLIRDFKEHEVVFTQKLKVTGAQVVLAGEFGGQYCMSDGMCKFFKLPIDWSFPALPGEVAPEDTVVSVSQDTVPKDTTPAVAQVDTATGEFLPFGPGPVEGYGTEQTSDCSVPSLLEMFLIAFVAGLGAILTPCVFPMIPMTVSFFLKQGEGSVDRAAGIRNGGIYALSIVVIYAGLGLFISTVFGESALYTLGSHWIPNLLFFAIFLVFAMSFFGMFDIVLPSSWSTAMNTKAGQGGILGPFFMALTLVIVSFSCTGPILGAAVVGSTQGAVCTWKPFMAFLGFGMAFGIPFGLLAAFPKLMEKLPMAGGWMNTVKVVFGFLELALCMKFLSNVDLALHWEFLDRQIFLAVWIIIFSLLGIYFLGWITMPHDEKVERVSVPRLLLAVLSLSFVVYMIPGLWGAPLQVMEGLAPPMNVNVGVRLQPHQLDGGESLNKLICKEERKLHDIMGKREAHGFCMFYDLKDAVAFAKKVNRPLFVDFTGHSCANCRKMESSVWIDEKVHKLLSEEFVMVSMYADEPHELDTPITTPDGKKLRRVADYVQYYQARNFGVVAQPYYAILGLDQKPMNKPRPYTPEVETYVKFLEEGVKNFKAKYGEPK